MKKPNTNLYKIVQALASGEFRDGTSLGQQLQITRSAIWKSIARLRAYGVDVLAVKGKGYALAEPLMLLNQRQLKALLKQRLPAEELPLELFESISSTNDYLRTLTDKKPFMVCLAEQQTQGKGRMGRHWHSPFGVNLYLSCLMRLDKDVSELAGMSLVSGVVVAKTLNSFLADSPLAEVKWPNDVLVAGQKIAGILIEVQAETHGACHVVVGIGMNINMLTANTISQPFTSLRKLTGQIVDRNVLGAELIANVWQALQLFRREGLAPFIKDWQALDGLYQQPITLQRANERLTGIVQGINEHGHLLLQLTDGVRAFSSGDVTICKG